MAIIPLDCIGLRCPQPRMKVTIASSSMKKGDILEVVADCHTFENDIREWCRQTGYTFLWCREEGDKLRRVQIRF